MSGALSHLLKSSLHRQLGPAMYNLWQPHMTTILGKSKYIYRQLPTTERKSLQKVTVRIRASLSLTVSPPKESGVSQVPVRFFSRALRGQNVSLSNLWHLRLFGTCCQIAPNDHPKGKENDSKKGQGKALKLLHLAFCNKTLVSTAPRSWSKIPGKLSWAREDMERSTSACNNPHTCDLVRTDLGHLLQSDDQCLPPWH